MSRSLAPATVTSSPLRLGFIGAPCTGKTTLTEFLFRALHELGLPVALAPEFAAQDIAHHGAPDRVLAPFEQLRYALHQRRLEEQAAAHGRIVLAESPSLVSYIYASLESRTLQSPRVSLFMQDLLAFWPEAKKRYHHLYLLQAEAAFENNGVRFHDAMEAAAMEQLLKATLAEYEIPYTLLTGTVLQRASRVVEDIIVAGEAPTWVYEKFLSTFTDPLTGQPLQVQPVLFT